jgi:diaminohydroxyphosphoribosylaminopyrimidine deaminase/5-amino-6-(5-phosphoribosylamino)uracil reductase
MEIALALAAKGNGFTSPNPVVGAVVVKDGVIVGQGWHKACGGPHAEVFALDEAGEKARGATIYVTLEPCNHTGKTPPCSHRIAEAGIKKVIMAMRDPNPVAKGGKEFLEELGIEVITGICEDKAKKLNEIFIRYTLTKRPFVILKYAATLDGNIATVTGDSKWITGPASRQFVHETRHLVDGILVGIGTVLADDPSLSTRIENFSGKDPHRIIIDPELNFPIKAKMLHQESESDTFIVCDKLSKMDSDKQKKGKTLENMGVRLIEMDTQNGFFDFQAVMKRLGEEKITSILIEGGSSIIASALNQKTVDKVFAFFAPKFVGGNDGIPVCKGKGVQFMKDAIQLENTSVKCFKNDVMIEGYII